MNTRSLNYAFAFLVLILFSKENITAQSQPAPLPLMIPPSPNAAALGDYGKVPVGLFTGTLQQNIPLYTIEGNDFSLPISLNYSSNGIKVSDAGSNVGLGWVLDAGGVITRTVNDETDEYSSSRITLPPVDFNTQQMSDFLLQATSNNTQDSEPDVFSFNVGAYAGKFYLTGAAPAMQAVLVSPSPLKIELLPDFYTTSLTNEQIRITDPSGVVYSFGGVNGVERSDSKTYGSGGSADNPQSKLIKSAWYLYKIKLLNGDEINFTYTSQLLKYDAGISQTLSSAISYKPSTGYTVQKATHSLPKVTGVNVSASKLTEINWKNGKISFAYSLRFTGGTTTMEKMDNMVISTKNNSTFTVLKKYAFNYLSVDAVAFPNPDNLNGNYIDARKRLFLSDVIAQSPAGTELNRHTFEYYNHTELPNRLSYAQDYWGYFNGKTNPDLVTDDVSSYNPDYYQVVGSSFSADAIKQLFNDVGGDKKVDAQFAVKGMLKKVTYPTGGYSSFEYESHTTGKIETVLPTTKENVTLHKSLPPDGRADVITMTTPIIPFEQYRVEFFPTVAGNCTTSPQNVNFQVTVKEIQSNTNVALEEFDGATYTSVTTPKRILWNDLYVLSVPKRYFFTFKQGKSYTISISLLSHHTCVDAYGDLNFSYYSQNTTQQWVNTPIGGMRISKITTADLTGNEQIKRYYYGSDLNNLNRSTGKARIVEPAINYFESLTNVPNGEVSEEVRTLIANLNSNPLHDLYNAQGYHITYGTVIEGNGNNFDAGATLHNFNTVTEVPPTHYRDPVMGTPFENVFGNGEEIRTVFYKNVGVFVKVSETNRTYVTDTRLNHTLSAFRATKRSSSYINSAETYNLSVYGIKSQWRYLSSEAETTYDQGGANPAIATTTYQYDNALHLQPTVTTTVLENAGTGTQHSFKTTTKYPQDFTFPGTLSGSAATIKSMVDKHIWNNPIEQLKSSITGSVSRVVDGQLSTYKLNGTFIVKDKDYALKFNNSTIYQDIITVTPSTINSSGVFVYDSHYEQLNSYSRYDASNNLLEAIDRKNTSSFIREPNTGDVWAKIANSTYAGVAYSSFEHSTTSGFTNWSYNLAGIVSLTDAQNGAKAFTLSATNLINSAQTLSSTQKYKVSFWRKTSGGTTFSVKASGVTVTLRTGPVRKGWQYYEGTFTGATTVQITGNATVDELRLYPQNSRMNSYVYKDGVGPISQCDENNQNTFWEYDEFNRLKLTRDQDGNIISKNEYKYQDIQN